MVSMPRVSQSGGDMRSPRSGHRPRLVRVLDPSSAPSLVVGVLAGLGVAVPLGPVGLLVARTGAVRGLRHGLAAGAGVAVVDTGYAVLSLVAGTGIASALAGRERAVAVAAATLLLGVAAHLLRSTLRADAGAGTGPDAGTGTGPDDGARARPGSPVRVAARFVLLTAVNPLTVLTFAALAAALPRGTAGTGFVVGVAAASGAWQAVLAGSGALLGARTGPAGRRRTGIAGAVAVALAALVTLARAV
jgi:threonine/homoserine/homoserine lactone efflux protein